MGEHKVLPMFIALAFLALSTQKADPLADAFKNPPASARPHTWWHWMDGNVSKEGITADLEAMKQVGIGGAQMFTVSQDIPPGKAGYMSPLWRQMTTHAIKEAGRLGIELCIHNCAGWSSSGGPWIKPEDAMQVLAWSELKVEGGKKISETLPQPKAPQVYANVNYYKDLAVYAFPTPEHPGRIPNFLERTGVVRGDGLHVETEEVGSPVASGTIINLTGKMGADGKLDWDAPAGNWTILRMGHVPTGKDNHPAPPEGDGLEVDKLSKEALDKHWNGMMAKVIADAGPLAGKVLNNSLIDSYEVGSQNWTPKFRQEFQRLRGYDPMPFLPTIAGQIIDSREKTEKFLWDFRRTIADLFAENYYGHFAELCHSKGMKFSTEPYGNGGFDTIQSGSKADIIMGEFWIGGGAMETTKLASSVAHVYGQKIVGAESFTADENRGRWLEEPFAQKALGDQAFANGINRYIFHRYAQQPWMNLRPGMTMGPWGTHLERTQTWWTEAGTWLKYVARCQYLLQSGRFVADACYYYGEDAPVDMSYGANLKPQLPKGYDYDGCDAGAVRSMTVKNGRIVLPSGMSYPLLILPEAKYMTPALARKVRDLVEAGATIYGSKPIASPSLQGGEASDDEVRAIASELWPASPNPTPVRKFGKGQVISTDVPLAKVMAMLKVAPDFDYSPRNYGTQLLDIHRRIGDAEVYFVSNQRYNPTTADCTFRVSGKVPEIWNAEDGSTQNAVAYRESGGRTTVSLRLGPAESAFVVFRKAAPKNHLLSFGVDKPASSAQMPHIEILRARYESADGRGADVTAQVRELVKQQQFEIPASNSLFGDPVYMVVKHLVIDYKVDGKLQTKTVGENESIMLVATPTTAAAPAYEVRSTGPRAFELTAWSSLSFGVTDSSAKSVVWRVRPSQAPKMIDLSRSWKLTFPPKLGAPASASFDQLISWPTSRDEGIKYFSGSAVYSKEFTVPASFVGSHRAIRLDLGTVKNFATVTLNGKPVVTLWKAPFVADLSGLVRAGKNSLQIKVTNLWPNRIIGDEHLPPDVEWNGNHLKKWPEWLLNGEPRPKTGRITFTTWHYYNKDSPLLESGLIGPVKLQSAEKRQIRF